MTDDGGRFTADLFSEHCTNEMEVSVTSVKSCAVQHGLHLVKY